MSSSRILGLSCLILAGELIFSLPFHITRYFRPSFLEVFGLSNAALGDIFAGYGVIAMLAYFPGGLIADRFSARKLIAVSLIATAAGGLFLTTIPSEFGVRLLFAYWGLTTILLFWAALLRATREWGGRKTQGLAFGLLDGGRGLVAAVAASVAVLIFSATVGSSGTAMSDAERTIGIQQVIFFYTCMTFTAGVLCWFFVTETTTNETTEQLRENSGDVGLLGVLRSRLVWSQAGIVLAAYCAYKGLDNYGLYAVEVLGMDEVASARLTAMTAYLRPVGAIAAGIVADRVRPSRVITGMFLILVLVYSFAALADTSSLPTQLLLANLFISYLAVFALRGTYFALLEEISMVKQRTGTAIGVVSVVGFTPDVFFFSIGGRLLDNNPGIVGHQHYFLLLAAIACVGLIVSSLLIWQLFGSVKARKLAGN